MARALNPPFGTYALPENREALRRKAEGYKNTRWGRTMISSLRKRALKGLNEPFDIEVAPGVNARLYPSQNRCEKRAIAGVQIWDAAERDWLKRTIQSCGDDSFVFLDVGANVGLYSIFAAQFCRDKGITANIYAIEPGKAMAGRLSDNVVASEAKVQIIRAAISDAPGTGHLSSGGNNRGEAQLMEDGTKAQAGELVIIDTLARIVLSHGLSKIHALKLDIEGHDLKALSAFFDNVPEKLFPGLLILETGKDESVPLIDLCKAQGYALQGRYGLNAVMTRKGSESE